MKNYYKVLGISESATINEIVDAYKMLAPQYHPDNNKGDDYAQERFIDLSVAYKTLINSDIRKDYDRILKGTLEVDKGATAVAATATRTATHVDLHDNISKDGEHHTKLNKTVRYVAIFSIIFIIASIAITVSKVMNRNAHKNNVATGNNNDAATIAKTTATPVVSNTPIVEESTTPPAAADKDDAKPDVVTTPTATSTPKVADNQPEKKTTTTPPVVADKKNTTTTSNKTNTPKADDAAITTDTKPATVQSFAINANKSTVLTVQGTPTSIVRYDNNTEIWSYGNSKVVFVNGVVASFKDVDHNLKTQ